jgi:hypothetical protein
MGAQEFEISKRGYTMKEAYDCALEDNLDEYGHQEGYSGTISSTDRLIDLTSEFQNSKKTPGKFIKDKLEDCPKRTCYTICIKNPKENKNKIKSAVEHIVTPGTKKWVLKYVVRTPNDHFVGSWPTKGEALKDARRYTEANRITTIISMEKQLEKGNSTVARVSYKQATNEEPGMWIFFGVAAC